jgi:hypothetical protein
VVRAAGAQHVRRVDHLPDPETCSLEFLKSQLHGI